MTSVAQLTIASLDVPGHARRPRHVRRSCPQLAADAGPAATAVPLAASTAADWCLSCGYLAAVMADAWSHLDVGHPDTDRTVLLAVTFAGPAARDSWAAAAVDPPPFPAQLMPGSHTGGRLYVGATSGAALRWLDLVGRHNPPWRTSAAVLPARTDPARAVETAQAICVPDRHPDPGLLRCAATLAAGSAQPDRRPSAPAVPRLSAPQQHARSWP